MSPDFWHFLNEHWVGIAVTVVVLAVIAADAITDIVASTRRGQDDEGEE
jgi:hypothetical protein